MIFVFGSTAKRRGHPCADAVRVFVHLTQLALLCRSLLLFTGFWECTRCTHSFKLLRLVAQQQPRR